MGVGQKLSKKKSVSWLVKVRWMQVDQIWKALFALYPLAQLLAKLCHYTRLSMGVILGKRVKKVCEIPWKNDIARKGNDE